MQVAIELTAVIIKVLVVLGVVSLIVAYLTYAERKIIARMQMRMGPMRVGYHGLLQPFADVIKLLFKEDIVPTPADRWVFFLAPVMVLVPAFAVYAAIPFAENFYVADINIGLLFVLAVSSLGVYGIVLAGWASNSKYSLLGGFRSSAQLISYEIFLGFALIGPLMLAGSLNLREIVEAQRGLWLVVLQPLAFVLYFIAGTAETNRIPFDLPEAETELVAGFHTEYSGIKFALFFLAEYTNMLVVAALATIVFLGGWRVPFLSDMAMPLWIKTPMHIVSFLTKMLFFQFMYFWLRATLPRFRFDQLMAIGWKVMFPLALANIAVTGLVYYLLL